MQREIRLFVVSDDRHEKFFIQAQIGIPTTQQADVVDLGFDAHSEHRAVHNLLQAIGAEVNHNMTAIDPDSLPVTRGQVALAIDGVMKQVEALKRPQLPGEPRRRRRRARKPNMAMQKRLDRAGPGEAVEIVKGKRGKRGKVR